MIIKDLYKDIEDILLSMDLTIDISSPKIISDEELIKIEKPLLDDLIDHICNRINNTNKQFLILSNSDRYISVDDLIKKLEQFKVDKGNFEIGISQISEDEYNGFLNTYDNYDKRRPYLHGYTTELTNDEMRRICEEELNVFKKHLTRKFYEYNQLLECKSIRDKFFEKYRKKKLNRIV